MNNVVIPYSAFVDLAALTRCAPLAAELFFWLVQQMDEDGGVYLDSDKPLLAHLKCSRDELTFAQATLCGLGWLGVVGHTDKPDLVYSVAHGAAHLA